MDGGVLIYERTVVDERGMEVFGSRRGTVVEKKRTERFGFIRGHLWKRDGWRGSGL